MVKAKQSSVQAVSKCKTCKGESSEMPNGRCMIACDNMDSDVGTCLPSSCSLKD